MFEMRDYCPALMFVVLLSVGGGCATDRGGSVEASKPERPKVLPSLTMEQLESVMDQNRDDIDHCYAQEIARDPDLIGRVIMRWIIMPTGEVTRVAVSECAIHNPALEACLIEHIGRWVFPRPKGGGVVHMRYPFDVSPGAAESHE